MSDKVEDKLREMAKLTILSNRISEVHEKNLKMYPLVFFNGVSQILIDYDFSQPEKRLEKEETKLNAGSVTFRMDVDLEQNPHLDRRLNALEMSVKNLFWQSTKVLVYLNGQLKLESKK